MSTSSPNDWCARRVTAARRALAPARSWKYEADAQSSDRTTFCLTYVLRNAAAPGWSPRRDCWVVAHASHVWQSLWFRLRAELWLAVRRPAGSPVPLCSEWPVKKAVDGRPAPGTVYQFICSDTVRPTPTPASRRPPAMSFTHSHLSVLFLITALWCFVGCRPIPCRTMFDEVQYLNHVWHFTKIP